ncbi:MAG: DNA repair protein RadA, partial [Clostridiales bacterium]|nr:DNA repair protein RadA [Clostridiales bacterium]
MAKSKTVYICQECAYETPRWLGKCPSCNQWNTLVEEVLKDEVRVTTSSLLNTKPVSINDIEINSEERYKTGISELDRTLGGGLVKGSLILVGGDPGIGKSTLILQLCEKIKQDGKILYISGEESVSQIKLRANRLEVKNPNLLMVSETRFNIIDALINNEEPKVLIIDSIQTMYNDELNTAPGSVSQVRDVTCRLMNIAKNKGISTIIVGHVTKDGSIAGPRVLEHMVDTVLYFEGERNLTYRILRAVKNRFGSTNEMGMFEMKEEGLVEVTNPSEIMLAGKPNNAAGSVVVSTLEGTRTMLIEVQALVAKTVFGMSRRTATGVDYNRINMLIAVLEKKLGIPLGSYDAYINVIGGLKIDETACDLGIITALISSFKNVAIDSRYVFIGEVGLTGEVRAVSQIEKRIIEAERLGFTTVVIPNSNFKLLDKNTGNIVVKGISNIRE